MRRLFEGSYVHVNLDGIQGDKTTLVFFLSHLSLYYLKILLSYQHNKAFKTDSQRSAFLVCFGLSVYGTIL
ncbi:hypothetical protein AL468_00390 [Vibrio diabolicus]|uniref:Uncharacterized protein n=1 Tax=Vibrio diabolicus TaxID=50719 RepID=A0ABM6S6F0_9VIBR|nr:hypothetical protein AL468_00390 [Vibrio diabolicus]